jgi:hypothetical protein
LARTATDLGLTPSSDLPHVFGLFMEWSLGNGVATLVSFAEGSTSLYFSSGGGIIGAGQHESVRRAAMQWLRTAEQSLRLLAPSTTAEPPAHGRVRFLARTFEGSLAAEANEDALGQQRDPLSPLFYAGQAVITAIRKTSPK